MHVAHGRLSHGVNISHAENVFHAGLTLMSPPLPSRDGLAWCAGHAVVTILCDWGGRHLSRFHNAACRAERGLTSGLASEGEGGFQGSLGCTSELIEPLTGAQVGYGRGTVVTSKRSSSDLSFVH